MPLSSWLIGARPWSDQAVIVDGLPAPILAPLGGLYLAAPQQALSLLQQLRLACFGQGLSLEVRLLRNRRVELVAAAPFSLEWAAAPLARELLGFDGDLTGAASYTAPHISPVLWSPGKTETPKRAPLGVLGGRYWRLSAQQGLGDFQVIRQHGDPTIRNRFEWAFIRRERYWTSDAPPPGEFAHFFSTTLIGGHRFRLFRKVNESDSSSEPANLLESLGPYVLDLKPKRARNLVVDRASGFGKVEAYYDVALDVLVQPEHGQV